MQMEIEGQEITYKDLPELREKLTSLLAKAAEGRELHEREAKRFRQQEKKLRAFLGDSGAVPVVESPRELTPEELESFRGQQ